MGGNHLYPDVNAAGSESQRRLLDQQAEIEKLKAMLAGAPPAPSAPMVSESQRKLNEQQAEMEQLRAMLAAQAAPPPVSESQRKLVEQQAEMEKLKAMLAGAAPTPSAPPFISESQRRLDEQQAEMEKLKALLAAQSAPPPISESQRRLNEQQAEMEKLKALLAAQSAPPPISESQRRLNEQQVEMEKLKAMLAAQSSPPPVSESQRKIAEQQAEMDKLRAMLSGGTPYAPPVTESQRKIAEQQAEMDKLKAMLAAKSAPPVISESQRRINEQQAEMEKLKAMLAGNATPSVASSAVTESQRKIAEQQAEMAKLMAMLSGGGGSSSTVTESQRKLNEQAAELEKLKNMLGSTTASKSTLTDYQKELEALNSKLNAPTPSAPDLVRASRVAAEKEEEKLKKALDSLTIKESQALKKREEELAKQKRELESLRLKEGSMASTKELVSQIDAKNAAINQIHKGIDLCIVLDCTGSMGSFMEAAKSKIRDIIVQVSNIDHSAVVRCALVGYRDITDDERFVIVDFEDVNNGILLDALMPQEPDGGGDIPEDIAGALEKALDLSWRASTKLLVHFTDAPCHGTMYHNNDDTYPSGDPSGLDPQNLLQQLSQKRVDYYFARIHSNTDKMTDIFSGVYKRSGSAAFEVLQIGQDASKFLPTVVKSVTASMQRSGMFKDSMSRTSI